MSAEKAGGPSPRTTQPGSLLSQWWTLGTLAADKRASGRHLKVAWVIIDRHMAKKGNALASVRYIHRANGMSKTTVAKACHELVEWGFFTQVIGTGTRATEFTPTWSSVPPVWGNGIIHSVPPLCDASVPPLCDANEICVTSVCDESYLRCLPTGRLTVSRNHDAAAAPTAPPLAVLAHATADAAADPKEESKAPKRNAEPFDELWAAYPVKRDRAKARAAYKKLAPDGDLHASLVSSAAALAEHYKTSGTEERWWKRLHNWLAEERYMEDLPLIHENVKEGAIAKKIANGPVEHSEGHPSPDLHADNDYVGITPRTPFGRHRVEIIGSNLFSTGSFDDDYTTLRCDYRIDGGKHDGMAFSHKFFLMCRDEEKRNEGQRFFRGIREATGIEEPQDTDEFHGHKLLAVVDRKCLIAYEPV